MSKEFKIKPGFRYENLKSISDEHLKRLVQKFNKWNNESDDGRRHNVDDEDLTRFRTLLNNLSSLHDERFGE